MLFSNLENPYEKRKSKVFEITIDWIKALFLKG